MSGFEPSACPLCGSALASLFEYRTPPKGETRFAFSDTPSYYRLFLRCAACGHCVASHRLDLQALYEKDYVASTYGAEGIRRNFDRINALPPDKSDNIGRVRRVNAWGRALAERARAEGRAPTVLDVGSGLCVFLHRMKEAGWDGTALDPDERFVEHARAVVGVKGVCADFFDAPALGRFDLITLNKVLEHVMDPVAMLAKASDYLRPGGAVYVEVPDGEAAGAEGPGREEFFVEHYHAFSMASVELMVRRAGLMTSGAERLREPSSKFTLSLWLRRV
jgi:SAM-dependent methyltransferase